MSELAEALGRYPAATLAASKAESSEYCTKHAKRLPLYSHPFG
jgi:hypothetical protein